MRFKYDESTECVSDNGEFLCGKNDIEFIVALMNFLEGEKIGYRTLLEDYRKTNKHISGLLAEATKQGYCPDVETQILGWTD